MNAKVFSERLNTSRIVWDRVKETIRSSYKEDSKPWIIPYPHGPNSFTLLHIILGIMKEEKDPKPVTIVQSQTGNDLPFVLEESNQTFRYINRYAAAYHLPISTEIITPSLEDSFWVNVIGNGFPPPKTNFQYCGETLKIKPMVNWLKEHTNTPCKIILSGLSYDPSFRGVANTDELQPLNGLEFADIILFSRLYGVTPWGEKTNKFSDLYEAVTDSVSPIPYSLRNEEYKEVQGPCGRMNTDFQLPCWNCPLMNYQTLLAKRIDLKDERWYKHLFAIQRKLYTLSFEQGARDGEENRQQMHHVKRGRNNQEESQNTKSDVSPKDYTAPQSETLYLSTRREIFHFIKEREGIIRDYMDKDFNQPHSHFRFFSEEEETEIKRLWDAELEKKEDSYEPEREQITFNF
ncbi:hypothetical protein IMZ31_22535 (plasmid) [Pontibacillus sp. ALD_SL1]|uniref:hypothetical protein n=1 Tax=Pontibacillus sp. ALD_SL1 TaxID=2777185 RepID=UPI001A9625BA|nr:hypothetical protein [Pontibacillus sp. ALD_SL1]QST02234.1 hypothetical protein IMZ31_22535 [Pontibacillus sp. ALD_SL1]